MKNKRHLALSALLLFLAACGVFFHLWLNCGSASPVAAAVGDIRTEVQLPVLMYHSVAAPGEAESEYVISATRFAKDLQWLREHGYTAVSAAQLIAYVENGSRLPEKPVLLTFDDGYCNNYTRAFPLLQEYGMHAIISIIGTESDSSSDDIYRNPEHCNLSWGEVSLLVKSGLIEIGNHTDNLHQLRPRKGADRLPGETMDDYLQALTKDLSSAQQKIAAATGNPALIFAWPFGAYPTDGSANQTLKDLGFRLSLTSYQKMNVIKQGDPDSLMSLKRFLRTPDFSLESHLS